MEIVVVRHGKSVLNTSGKVNARDFGKCLQDYNLLGITEEYPPPQEVIQQAAKSRFTVCSTLTRSIHSAKLLGIDQPDLISPLFKEIELPYTNWSFPTLQKTTWPAIFRTFQLLGYAPNAESVRQALIRSKACASQLQQLSADHGSVFYVGHGALLWLLHKQLLKLGWLGPKKSVREHWEIGVYHYAG